MVTLQHLNIEVKDLKKKVDYLLYLNSQGGGGGSTSAAILTGTTLASNVVSSSITSVGTITSGTWNGTAISVAKGGTGLTTLGTASQQLRVNAGATALEYFTPSAGGSTPLFKTTGTDTATGAVTGELDGNVFTITQNGNEVVHIDPTADAEHTHIQALNTTGDGNLSSAQFQTTDLSGAWEITASFNDIVKMATIEAYADATTGFIAYSADTHTFTGALSFIDLAGGGTGSVAVDNDGLLSFVADFVLSATYFDGAGTVGDPVVPIIDTTITNGSVVPITSNAVFDALALKADANIYHFQAHCSHIFSLVPADATTYYFGIPWQNTTTSTSAGTRQSAVPANCTLIGYMITTESASTPTQEASTVSFRINNTTDILLSNAVTYNAANQVTNVFYAMNLATDLTAGDKWEIKWLTPTWATNPTGSNQMNVTLYFKTR